MLQLLRCFSEIGLLLPAFLDVEMVSENLTGAFINAIEKLTNLLISSVNLAVCLRASQRPEFSVGGGESGIQRHSHQVRLTPFSLCYKSPSLVRHRVKILYFCKVRLLFLLIGDYASFLVSTLQNSSKPSFIVHSGVYRREKWTQYSLAIINFLTPICLPCPTLSDT